MMSDIIYFNFPIVLLDGFLRNSTACLNNVFGYTLYAYTLDCEKGTVAVKIKQAENFFEVECGDRTATYNNGRTLYDSIPGRTPMVGVRREIFFDFYKNDKDEFQKVCLLGFLAIKSILQDKPYCKVDNKYWLSRMDGKTKSVQDFSDLSDEVRKYANEYQTKKIKSELIENWGMEHYSRYTRGFYVSFKLDLNQLVFEAEKRRKSTKEKQRREAEKLAIKTALERIATNARP